jgi:hypothetical protein
MWQFINGSDITCHSCGDVLKNNNDLTRELLVELLEHVIENEETS